MFYQSYGMEVTKYEESIKYFENTIKILIMSKWENHQYYDLANSLSFNNNNNTNDINSQNSVKQLNLFLSYLKYHSSFLVDGGIISILISGHLKINKTKIYATYAADGDNCDTYTPIFIEKVAASILIGILLKINEMVYPIELSLHNSNNKNNTNSKNNSSITNIMCCIYLFD